MAHGVRGTGSRRISAIVGVLAVVATACSSTGSDVPAGGTLTFATSDELPGFNVNKAENETPTARDVAENVFFYAFKADPSYAKTFPGLDGGRPPTLVSTNPQVVEWKIRKEAVWSDGTPVTSEDLRYFQSQIVAKDSLSTAHEGYELMKDVTVVDDKTLRATFDPRPYPEYQTLFAAVPQAAFLEGQPGGFNTGLDESPGPSAGPFQFEKWKKGDSLTLVRNPRWWGAPSLTPPLGSIVFKFIPDASAQVEALANGEVDMIAPEPDIDLVQQLANVDATRHIRTSLEFGPNWDELAYNLRNPILADVRVRRAIAHAVDRNAMVDKLVKPITSDATRLDNFVYMTNHPDYQAHGTQYGTADPDAARRLLDEAGWTGGKDGIRERNGERLSLRVTAATGQARYEQLAELASAQLRAVGIDLRSDNCDLDCLVERVYKGDFDVVTLGWGGNISAVSLIKGIFSSAGEQNFGKFSSAAFDDLIAQAQSVPDPAQQAALANKADEVLWEELPGLPLYQPPTLFAVSEQFVGMADNPNGDGIFWNSDTWGQRG
ncbi:MAG: glutathione transport system substrate-binding protein [Actinomycetota bacterium]|jgi:peptide/nickel transport system substrate-binding protein|nr:glutathione transport system substrate-binding protein [Actinomycetota bacterium]